MNITVSVTTDPDILAQIFRLRYEVYTHELKSFSSSEFPDKKECDIYDEYSTHIVALDDTRVVGTLRLVIDNPHGFVMEPAFTLPSFIIRGQTVEHSRGVIHNEYRGRSLYVRMLTTAYQWQRTHALPICIGAPNTAKLYQILSAQGWKTLGKPQHYHNIEVVPMYYNLFSSL